MARARWERCRTIWLSVFLLVPPALLAQITSPQIIGNLSKVADAEQPAVPLDEWLKLEPHSDFPWKVKLNKPEPVMMDNRMLLTAQAEISGSLLAGPKGKRDLHFFLRIADENGRWSTNGGYGQLPVSFPDQNANARLLHRPDEVSISIAMYTLLTSGKYEVAVIGYDRTTGERNLWKTSVAIPANRLATGSQSAVAPIEFVSLGELSQRWLPISVSNHQPVRIDVIALFRLPLFDITTSALWFHKLEEDYRHRNDEISPYPKAAPNISREISELQSLQRLQLNALYASPRNTFWQSVLALSKMHVDRGCVRATALVPGDSLYNFKAVDFESVDWGKETERIRGIHEAAIRSVDTRSLARHDKELKQYSDFVDETLSNALHDHSGCDSAAEQVRHLVLFVHLAGTTGSNVILLPDNKTLTISNARDFHKVVDKIVSEIK